MLALSACAELPGTAGGVPSPKLPTGARTSNGQAVGVLIARWHTGLVVPSGELGSLRVLLRSDPAARYVSVGWGDRRFYTAAHPNSADAFAALFPSRSVLLVQTVASASDAVPADGRVEWICADRIELWRLDIYLRDSLRWRAAGPVELGPGPLPESHFYASGARYDAFHTCNTWTLAALQFAGLPVRALGVLLAGQVGRRIRALPMCPLSRG